MDVERWRVEKCQSSTFIFWSHRARQPKDLWNSWIVITSVAPPTADVMYMASLPGWRVVVVGDEKTPVNWR